VITNHQRYRQTDGQTDRQTDRRHAIARPRKCTKVHCAVKTRRPDGKSIERIRVWLLQAPTAWAASFQYWPLHLEIGLYRRRPRRRRRVDVRAQAVASICPPQTYDLHSNDTIKPNYNKVAYLIPSTHLITVILLQHIQNRKIAMRDLLCHSSFVLASTRFAFNKSSRTFETRLH